MTRVEMKVKNGIPIGIRGSVMQADLVSGTFNVEFDQPLIVAGVPQTSFSFTAKEGTITDDRYGLEWEVK